MLFFLRNILYPMFSPLGVGLIFLVAGLVFILFLPRRRWGILCLGLGLFWLLLISNRFVSNALLWRLENRYPPLAPSVRLSAQDQNTPGNEEWSVLRTEASLWIVVLGTGYEPTWGHRAANHEASQVFQARLTEGIRLARLLPTARLAICVTGNAAAGTKHRFVQEMLAVYGLKPDWIDQDGDSESMQPGQIAVRIFSSPQNTVDEAKAAADVVRGCCAIVVTSASHMPRAMAAFQALDVYAVPAPCDYRSTLWGTTLLERILPSSRAVCDLSLLHHELSGFLWGKLTGAF